MCGRLAFAVESDGSTTYRCSHGDQRHRRDRAQDGLESKPPSLGSWRWFTQALECGDIEPEARAGMACRVGELWLHIGHLQGAAATLGAVVSCHRGTECYVWIDTIVQ
jgi:hypothetical protein